MSSPETTAPADAFEALLRNVEPRMKRLLSIYHVPADDAEDVVQQTLLALIYQWHTVRDPECWVLGTLKRHCLMYWRTQRRRLYSAVDSALLEWLSQPVAPAQERADLVCDLESLLDRLPARCRNLLKLRFRLGYEPLEVAERMGYRASSIGKITNRCLAALSREMMAAGLTHELLRGTPGPRANPPAAPAAGIEAAGGDPEPVAVGAEPPDRP